MREENDGVLDELILSSLRINRTPLEYLVRKKSLFIFHGIL